jgi:hypothetical protein
MFDGNSSSPSTSAITAGIFPTWLPIRTTGLA